MTMSNQLDLNNFAYQSIDDWKKIVSNDLKDGQTIADFQYLVGDCIKVDPFIGYDPDKAFEPADMQLPKSCIRIPSSSGTNAIALQVLNFGVDALCFAIDDTTDFDILFQDIDLAAIALYVEVDSEKTQDRMTDYIARMYPASHTEIHFIKTNSYLLGEEKEWCERWNDIRDVLHRNAPKQGMHFYNLPCKDDFLVQIAELRALRRILGKKYLDNQGAFQLMVQIPLDSIDDIHPLIPINYRIMSAYLGGADVIFWTFDGDLELTRLIAKIHHILREESRFAAVSDPMTGSYLVEDISLKIESFLS